LEFNKLRNTSKQEQHGLHHVLEKLWKNWKEIPNEWQKSKIVSLYKQKCDPYSFLETTGV